MNKRTLTYACVALVIIGVLLVLYSGYVATDQRSVTSETFDQLNEAIELELSKDNETLQKGKVLVALYLDDDGLINDPKKKAEYRCYAIDGRSYKGASIPYNTPWLTWERVRKNAFEKKIVIDAGPQYEIITKIAKLTPGQVTNLGYLTLEKVSEKPVASIYGVVRTEDGELLEGAKVSSKSNSTVTDSDGSYSIDVFRIGTCDLNVTKPGYVPSRRIVTVEDEDDPIERYFTLAVPRKVTIRYMITPGSINDFTNSKATGGTLTALVNKDYMNFPDGSIKNEDFRKFVKQTGLRFSIRSNKFRLRNNSSSVSCKLIQASPEKFEDITTVGPSDKNIFDYSDMHQGDILLIDGGDKSDYKIKLLFEKITRVLP